MSAGISAPRDATGPIIDWLTAPAFPDPHAEVLELVRHLDGLHEAGITKAQFHRCIELFFSRALQMCGEFRPELRTMQLPLAADWAESVRMLAASLLRIAQGFERVLAEASRTAIRTQRRLNETASARALRLLCELHIISHQAGGEPDPRLWKSAYNLYHLSRCEAAENAAAGSPAETTLFNYKRLLSMAALDPLSYSPGELDWAAEYTARVCGQLLLQEERPMQTEGAWYWIDPERGAEPQAWVRQAPPDRRNVLFFSTQPLARRAAELLARHEGGRTGPELEPSESFPGVQPASLLAGMRQRWHSPPKREQPRRRQSYSIDACVGLTRIWRLLRAGSDHREDLVSQWDVRNESPGGYAIMHIHGASSGLAAGTAVALRRTPNDAWTVCVVRWLRSEGEGVIEMGLQIVSHGAVPVQVGFRNGMERNAPMVDALVLPVLPALRQHQAVLAPSGTYTSRRFALVSDVDRLYIAQGRLLSLDMQTSNLELFQFEIDPYPL